MNNTEEWMPWELYLIILGERSTDYSYPPEILFEHLDYFKKCWGNHLSSYKALEMFSFHLDEKYIVKNVKVK